MHQVTHGLPADVAAFLDGLQGPNHYPSPDELDHILDAWASQGAFVEAIGSSRSGHVIRAATIGAGGRALLAWGYPHPDEPIGAAALVALGQGLLDGRLRLDGWRVHLVLCADPDETRRNLWLDSNADVEEFVRGCWRPSAQLGIEVDYGFPLKAGPFSNQPHFLGRCRTRSECQARCGESGRNGCTRRSLPFSPLPESRALAEALDRYRPDLVAAMHNAGMGGDYTFLLHSESRDVLDDLVSLPSSYGQPRHLGEALDRGRRWRRDLPDLIREPRLAEVIRWLERQPDYDADALYEDVHSAGNYIETRLPGTQFICPEVCQYRHPDFADVSDSGLRERVLVSVEDRASGRWQLVRIKVNNEWVVAEQKRAPSLPLARPRAKTLFTTRAMLGVRAVAQRRLALAAADRLWRQVAALEGLREHPYHDERWAQDIPGSRADGGALRIFLTDERYHRPATVASVASFKWGWPYLTAAQLGNFQNFLAAQDLSRPELAQVKRELDRIQDSELALLPSSLRQEGPRAPALRSQLARLLRLIHPAEAPLES